MAIVSFFTMIGNWTEWTWQATWMVSEPFSKYLASNLSWFESFPGFDLKSPITTKTEACLMTASASRPVMKRTKKTYFEANRHVCRKEFYKDGKFENENFELINFKPVSCEQRSAIYAVSEKSCSLLFPLEESGSI